MPDLRPLILILCFAAIVFRAGAGLAIAFSSVDDFRRRRNLWVLLTCAGFVLPSFWLYAPLALVLIHQAGRRDRNPLALYVLLLHVIPPHEFTIPMVGLTSLFALSQYRILALALLLPLVLLDRPAPPGVLRPRPLTLAGWALLAFLAIQLVLIAPFETSTNLIRRGILMVLDVVLLFLAAARTLQTRADLEDVLACYALAAALQAPVALFESFKGWLLYYQIGGAWGVGAQSHYLLRDGLLRAEGAAGHALWLGYLLAMGCLILQHLGTRVEDRRLGWKQSLWMLGGLLSTYSRGPWMVAMAGYLGYVGLSAASVTRLLKAIGALAAVVAVLLVSPLGGKLINMLPLIGQTDSYNLDYRQQVAEASWRLFQQKPWFGDPLLFETLYLNPTALKDLVQGEGIVDLVNGYAQIAVFFGLAGLLPFILMIVHAGGQTLRRLQPLRTRGALRDLSLGACLCGMLGSSLIMIATAGFALGLEKTFYLLIGLMVAFVRVTATQAAAGSARVAGALPHAAAAVGRAAPAGAAFSVPER